MHWSPYPRARFYGTTFRGILPFYAVHTFMRQTATSGKITYHTGLQRVAQEELLRMCVSSGGIFDYLSAYAATAYFGPLTHPAYRTSELWQELNGQ